MGNHDCLNERQTYGDAVRELNGEITALRAEIGRLKADKQGLADALKLECDAKYKWKRAAETLAYTIEEKRKASRDENVRLRELLRWAHDTLHEINPSNYDHDEVCKLNSKSVEVILGIAPEIGETHGKSPEWWAERSMKENEHG